MRLIDADGLKNSVRQKVFMQPNYICVVIDEEPTVDPVKHGHWIDVELVRSYGIMKGIQCSICGKQRLKGSCSVPNFCEDCGADMRAENGNGVSG